MTIASTAKSHLLSTVATEGALVTLSMITGVLVARLLGPTGRGEFAIAILWPTVIASFGSLGVREALTYEQAKATYPRSKLVGTAILLATVQSVLLGALGIVLIPVLTRAHSPEVTQTSLLYLWFIPANLLAQYSLGLMQGSLDLHRFNLVRLTVNVVFAAAVLILWLIGNVTVTSLVMSLLFANICTTALALALVLLKFGVVWVVDMPLIREILRYGLKNHVGSISYALNQRADQIFMAIFLAPQQLGWYAVAASVSGLVTVASAAFAAIVFPRIASTDRPEQRQLTSIYSRLNVTATSLLAVLLIMTVPVVIPLIYGPDYSPSVLPAEILTVAAIFVGIGQAWASSLRGLGFPQVPAKAELLSLLATVIGLALLLRPLGITGAAITSLIAYSISAVYLSIHLRGKLDLRLSDILKPVSPKIILSKFVS